MIESNLLQQEKYIDSMTVKSVYGTGGPTDIYKNPSPSEFAKLVKDNPEYLRGYVDKGGLGDLYVFDTGGRFNTHDDFKDFTKKNKTGEIVLLVFSMEDKKVWISNDTESYYRSGGFNKGSDELDDIIRDFWYPNLKKNPKISATKFRYLNNWSTYSDKLS